jgi:hypothetical protein
MDKTSALGAAQEAEAYQDRVWAAMDHWVAQGHTTPMPAEYKDLYECTLLSPTELIKAKARKVELLQSRLVNAGDLIIDLGRQLRELS